MTGISPVRLGAALAAPQACRLGGLGVTRGSALACWCSSPSIQSISGAGPSIAARRR